MTDDDVIQLGREAAAVLGNRAYQDAFEAVDRALFDRIADEDCDNPEELRYMLLMGRKYRKQLERALADGKFVAESLKQQAEQRKWWR